MTSVGALTVKSPFIAQQRTSAEPRGVGQISSEPVDGMRLSDTAAVSETRSGRNQRLAGWGALACSMIAMGLAGCSQGPTPPPVIADVQLSSRHIQSTRGFSVTDLQTEVKLTTGYTLKDSGAGTVTVTKPDGSEYATYQGARLEVKYETDQNHNPTGTPDKDAFSLVVKDTRQKIFNDGTVQYAGNDFTRGGQNTFSIPRNAPICEPAAPCDPVDARQVDSQGNTTNTVYHVGSQDGKTLQFTLDPKASSMDSVSEKSLRPWTVDTLLPRSIVIPPTPPPPAPPPQQAAQPAQPQ